MTEGEAESALVNILTELTTASATMLGVVARLDPGAVEDVERTAACLVRASMLITKLREAIRDVPG
jgi:hypothetical protein